MATLNVTPTKSNLQRLKRDLAFAREGYEMLEQKRQILVLELMGSIADAKTVQAEVEEKMAQAFKALRQAMVRVGTLQMTAETAAPRPAHSAELSSRPIMGIYLPNIEGRHPAVGPVTSLLAGSPAFDDVTAAFTAALKSIDRLAEVENSVIRLAREVRKTQRRVNALEKIFIPSYEGSIKFITSVLEERERDEFIVLRIVKERVEKRRNAQSG